MHKAEPKDNNYVHKLKKPFEYEGKKIETFNFCFEDLTGRDMLNVESEMALEGEYSIVPEASIGFQYRMAARAAQVGSDVVLNLPLYEFKKITAACRDFLLAMG